MAEFNEFKEKIMSTIGAVADVAKDAAQKTADTAKGAARIAKLTMEIGSDKDTVAKAYSELGKLYYEKHRDDAEGFFSQIVQEITVTKEQMAAREDEIEEIKANMKDRGYDGIDVDFEDVVAQDEADEAIPTVDDEDIAQPEPVVAEYAATEEPTVEEAVDEEAAPEKPAE